MSPDESDEERTLLVDASVFITLAAVDAVDLLVVMEGTVVVPERVAEELADDRSRAALAGYREDGSIRVDPADDRLGSARTHLGVDGESGDVGLLAHAMATGESMVAVTDDRPLRQTCKALSVPVSGSLGVVIRGVERGEIAGAEAKDLVYAMDEVGARLSATLVRRAERLIDDAIDE
jgi:predicted nucleic acid-binding protein